MSVLGILAMLIVGRILFDVIVVLLPLVIISSIWGVVIVVKVIDNLISRAEAVVRAWFEIARAQGIIR